MNFARKIIVATLVTFGFLNTALAIEYAQYVDGSKVFEDTRLKFRVHGIVNNINPAEGDETDIEKAMSKIGLCGQRFVKRAKDLKTSLVDAGLFNKYTALKKLGYRIQPSVSLNAFFEPEGEAAYVATFFVINVMKDGIIFHRRILGFFDEREIQYKSSDYKEMSYLCEWSDPSNQLEEGPDGEVFNGIVRAMTNPHDIKVVDHLLTGDKPQIIYEEDGKNGPPTKPNQKVQ